MADEKPIVTIDYCPKCGWLLRASWMAQELLTTFSEELGGVLLRPSEKSGSYIISLGNEIIWDRYAQGRFPDIKILKQRVRDVVAPDRSLGHTDRP